MHSYALGSEEEEEEPPAESPKPVSTNSSQLLQERLKMYETAEKNAKEAGEIGRARRFARGTKSIKDLLKQVNAGKAINEEDIPPEVTVNTQKHEETVVAVVSPEPEPQPDPATAEQPQPKELSEEKLQLVEMLNGRKNEYKMAALAAKKSGDQATAITYIKVSKQFDAVIAAVEAGQPVDLSGMPGPPSTSQPAPQPPAIGHSEVQKQADEQQEMEAEAGMY